MLTMDISNLWSCLSLPELLSWEAQLGEAQRTLCSEFTGSFSHWTWLPDTVPAGALGALRAAARQIRQTSDTLVVVGSDEAVLGVRGLLELLRGRLHNENPAKPRILFTGSSLSSRDALELSNLLSDREFSLCFLTYAGTTIESALAYRAVRAKLAEKYGEAEARSRTYVVSEKGEAFTRRAEDEGVWVFGAPKRVCGRFSVLSAVGFLPLLVAGLEPEELLSGAAEVEPQLLLGSFENPAWLYCAGRRLLWEKGRSVELLVGSEGRMGTFLTFFQHLFADYPGPLSLSVLYGRDARLSDGRDDVFETWLRLPPPEDRVEVAASWDDADAMGYLEGRALSEVEQAMLGGILEEHLDKGIPAFQLEGSRLDARFGGALVHFVEFSAALWTELMGEDPFAPRQAGAARRRMLRALGSPGAF